MSRFMDTEEETEAVRPNALDGCLLSPLLSTREKDVEHAAATHETVQLESISPHKQLAEEVKPSVQRSALLRLACPIIVQNLFGHSLSLVAVIAVGHLDNPAILSAVVLASSIYNVTGYSVIVGLSTGSDTLSGQAFGAGAYKQLGLVLQRSVVICWVVCVPLMVLWVNARPLFELARQSEEIAGMAARYLALTAPTIFVSAVSANVYRYLLAQRVVRPASICTAITALLCPVYNYLLIHHCHLGLDGAAAAFFASNATYTALLLGFTVVRDLRLSGTSHATWAGFSLRGALSGWGGYLKYGAPAAAMVCCEWWVFELVIIFAGMLDNAEAAVAVMGIAFHVSALAYMVPSGVGQACNITVANALGAGHAHRARTTYTTSLGLVVVMQTLLCAAMYLARVPVVRVFTDAPAVIDLARTTMPVVCATVVADGLNSLLSGVLRGCGRQSWGAALNLIGYWCVGFPLSLLLGFKFHMTTVGFWAALCTASAAQALIMLVVISRINWSKEVDRARALVGAKGEGVVQDHVGTDGLDWDADEAPPLVGVCNGGGGCMGDQPVWFTPHTHSSPQKEVLGEHGVTQPSHTHNTHPRQV